MERTTFCLPRKFSNVVSCLTQGAFMCPCVSHWMFICAYRVNFQSLTTLHCNIFHVVKVRSKKHYKILLLLLEGIVSFYDAAACCILHTPNIDFYCHYANWCPHHSRSLEIILKCYQRNLLRSAQYWKL